MNNELLMNDTFDNLSFSEHFATEQLKPSENKSVKADISLDDSIFLSDFTPLTAEQSPKSSPRDSPDSENKENTNTLNFSLKKLSISSHKSSLTPSNSSLESWGLPEPVLEKYSSKGIKTMFPWQVECLSNVKVLKGTNLLYSAPTSAGKTLVAEILALKTIFERNKKVIFILPFVSIVREKMYYFQEILGSAGIRVEGFMGSYNPPGGFQSIQLAICTMEKANSLINRLLEENKLSEIGAILVDELHLLGDPSRGYLLELLLTKLRYISMKDSSVNIQIIGMSATLPNLPELAKWLDAELYTTDFRPIPLREQAHVNGEMYDSNLQLLRKIPPSLDFDTDTDNILQLCLETIQDSCSVLIFCPTKQWCESLAQQIASAFFKLGNSQSQWGACLRNQFKTDAIVELLEQFKYCPVGLDNILRKTISFGVAFHHAGLTMDERDIIESAFRKTTIRVLIATSTLSSGVNLPARRVIIRTPNFHGKPIDTLTYRQMIGRAGRMGKDVAGESILICQKNDYKIAKELMSAQLKPVESCLEGAGKLKRAILEVIASGVATTPDDVNVFTKCTLLAVELAKSEDLYNPIEETIEFLLNCEFIRLQKSEETLKYVATSLGKACLSSSMAPDEGLALFTELEKARRCLVLETDLHLIYLVTPYSACNQWPNLDWMMYLDMWERLPAAMRRVGELVGISEYYIVSATRGKIQSDTTKTYHKLLVHKRFFIALALQDLVNEKPLTDVCAKFNCNRGMLQSLQQSASSFAGMVTAFCRQLGWGGMEILVEQFQDRLQFGVSRDLLDLMRLQVLNGKMARTLYDMGVVSLIQLAVSTVDAIENILYKVRPFESEKARDGETDFDKEKRNKVRNLFISGKEGMNEREVAEMIVMEARSYLKTEMGLADAKWEQEEEKQVEIEVSSPPKIEITEVKNESACESVINSNQSDHSIFNESFSLKLSESNNTSNDSGVAKELHPKLTEEYPLIESDSFLERAFCSSFNISDAGLNNSSDIFTSPLSEEEFKVANKKRIGGEQINVLATPSKRQKLSPRELNLNDCYEVHKLLPGQKDYNKFEIINVCTNLQLLETFIDKTESFEEISFSIACETATKEPTIGANVLKASPKLKNKFSTERYKIVGFALSNDGEKVYYISVANEIYHSEIIKLLKRLMANKKLSVKMFDCKEQLRVLKECFESIDLLAKFQDVRVAEWLLDPEGDRKDLQALASLNCPEIVRISQLSGVSKGPTSVALAVNSAVDPKMRSSVEAITTWHVLNAFKCKLNDKSIKAHVYDIEMRTVICLIENEIYGMAVDKNRMQLLVDLLRNQMRAIEKKAFTLAGRKFSFNSSHEVAKVLGMLNGKRKVSTRKQVLEKNEHPVSDLVLHWRKLSTILSKMLLPLLRVIQDDRISGTHITHTSTGRITMHDPNLQSLAKDFDIVNPLTEETTTISCRSAFVAKEKHVLISADYCQLELRLLAHFSRDNVLHRIMRSPGDVFKSIASKWNKVDEREVDDNLRQNAKHLCYGIIYGMGSKTLAEQLSIDENDAVNFMDSFKNTYPGIKTFIVDSVQACQRDGYVETLMGRKRYLPHINDTNGGLKGQAERQAVNTTVQGSAADVAKRAMVNIDEQFKCKFEKSRREERPMLILHLHDELMYEVPEGDLRKCAMIIKECMENAVRLSVPLPVKLKSGYSWGQLKEYSL